MHKLFHRVRFSVSVSALLSLLIGLSLTSVLFAALRQIESARHQVQFEQSAQRAIGAVSGGLQDAVEQLLVLNQLFRTMGAISAEQFHTFSTPLLTRYPGIEAFSYQRVLVHSERRAFELAKRLRQPDFSITDIVDGVPRRAALRERYNVIDYLEPLAGNEIAYGLDTGQRTDQSGARRRSRISGRAAATGLLTLAQHPDRHSAFLVFAPVYWQGAPLDTPDQRQRATIGETAAVFDAPHLIGATLAGSDALSRPGMSIAVFAGGDASAGTQAYQHGTPSAPMRAQGLMPSWLWADRSAPVRASFAVADTEWSIALAQAPLSFVANHGGSLYVLLGGMLSSLLGAAYVFALVSRKETIERVAGERTSMLEFANLRLSEDLALREHTEKALRLRERVIEVSSNAIIICSASAPDYPIEYVNPAFERITGFAASEVVGRSLESLQGNSQDQQNIEEIRAALREQREGHAMLRNYRKDGSDYWNELFVAPVRDDRGAISHFVVAQYDISAVLRFEAELAFQAKHDTLTGLANRDLLRERLTLSIVNARRSGTALWVVFVDLDRFKFVNDTLGHEAGDTLLKTLAGRLKSAAREADTVARLGGDEFVLVLPDHTDDVTGMEVLTRIMDAVAQPLVIEEHEFLLTCSIGVATFPNDGDSAESLTKHADIAMYRAKEMGRNTFQFYTAAMNERTLDRLSIEADLRHALEREEFVLHYQPQVSLESGRIVAMEALLRWNHPLHGMIAPARFIGLAEEMGLIIPIGAWVLRTACQQTVAWQQAGLGELRVAVNLSARQFTQKSLVQSIAGVLSATGLEARLLELELTESMVMHDIDNAIAILRNLKGLGIHISIDDFGTGYSSLAYLRRFPIDVLKIDQSFVNDLNSDPDDAAIVVSIISLAHSLRLCVIAEGVETAEQLAFLRRHGCNQMQGYYFSRPLTAGAFEALLREGRSLPSRAEIEAEPSQDGAPATLAGADHL